MKVCQVSVDGWGRSDELVRARSVILAQLGIANVYGVFDFKEFVFLVMYFYSIIHH